MEKLSASDLRQILEFTKNLYAVQNEDSLIDTFVNGLHTLIQGDVHSYSGTNSRDNTVILRDAPGGPVMTAFQQECYTRFSLQHPSLAYCKQTGDGQAVKVSDFLSLADWKKTDLYNLVYRPHQLSYNLGALLTLSKDNDVMMVFGVSRGRRDFSERDRTIANLLRPHLLQASGNARVVSDMEKRMAVLTKAVDQLDQAVAEVDRKGKVIWATEKAQTLLQKIGRRRKGHSSQLPSVIWNWMQRSLKQPSESENNLMPVIPLKVERASSCIRLRVMREGDTTLLFLDEHFHQLPVERLRQLGLSPRETEVLRWMTQGKSNPEIAEILAIGVGTVKTHLERIYDKLGVDHRYAAMSRALEVLGTKDRL